MKPISFTLKIFGREYFLLFLALLAAMVAGRLYEAATLGYYHGLNWMSFAYISGAVIRDLQWCLIGTLLLWPMYRLCRWLLPESEKPVAATVITLAGLTNILLISYFVATLTPLGPEFRAYSLREMSNTVMASGRISFWSVLMLLVIGIALYRIVRTLLERNLSMLSKTKLTWALPLAVVFMLIPPLWIIPSGGAAITNYQSNKLAYFISATYESASPEKNYEYTSIKQEYPFLHPASDQSTLAPFFKEFSEPPNIVFLIVESLGGEFVGTRGQWTGFAPNLDSLARAGLYWENGLSLSGRTFGMMPSLFGSLPPGSNGFMDLGPDYPNHETLISLLDRQGYQTSFFSGFNTYFDKLDYFLEYQGIDFVLNRQNINRNYVTDANDETQNYWGYDDKTMLSIASAMLDTATAFPRLDIYHTLQSHSPFTVPDQQQFENKFDSLVTAMDVEDSRKEAFRRYHSELTTLLYADEAIGEFMDSYRKRSHFKNTIFIITGDHWLIPVSQTSQLSRYHVPIIIYSPLLKEPAHFKSVNTHANIAPGLTSLLQLQTGLSFPDSVHWIGSSMDTTRTFQNIHSLPLMKNKNQLSDYLDHQFYLSDDRLFRLEEDLKLSSAVSEDKKNLLGEKLLQFKARNHYAIINNKLYPGTTHRKIPGKYAFIAKYDTLYQRLDSIGLTTDEQFQEARQLAFDGDYERARAIARRLLLEYPEYHDVQLLVGRTYAWQGNYNKARETFKDIINREPEYYDTYNALFDVEYWDNKVNSALEIINKGLEYHPEHDQFLEKKIRALVELNRKKQALQVFNILQKKHPDYNGLPKLKLLISEQ